MKRIHLLTILATIGLSSTLLAQTSGLPHGKYPVGYQSLRVWYANGQDSIPLVLNLWYPTQTPSGSKTKLLEYTFNHLNSRGPVTDSVRVQKETALRTNIHHWFGNVSDEKWTALKTADTYSFKNAPFHARKFPLILGRLRAFSTTLTNEYLSSRGYVVCMLTPVDDFPPDNEDAYHQQLTAEMKYYLFLKDHLQNKLKITSPASGLLGFSGSGFSQFITPMAFDTFSAVALLESGVLLKGVGDILARHPAFSPAQYNAALLFLYNKTRFENTNQYPRFSALNSAQKYAALIDFPDQHHWDVAAEGTITSLYLNIREKNISDTQIRIFNTMNELLASFFDHFLKKETKTFSNQKEIIIINGK